MTWAITNAGGKEEFKLEDYKSGYRSHLLLGLAVITENPGPSQLVLSAQTCWSSVPGDISYRTLGTSQSRVPQVTEDTVLKLRLPRVPD